MSKVICDVCGTTYPETASVCPICGSAKNTTVQTAAGGTLRDGASYVKGGRFSKRNVKKRNQSKTVERKPERSDKYSRPSRPRKKSGANTGLTLLIVLLLIGIVVVMFYIGIRYFLPGFFNSKNDPSETKPPVTTTEPAPVVPVPCVSVKLNRLNIHFKSKDEAELISVEVSPVDTTDKLQFMSSDEDVAIIDRNGRITAVGGGEAVITVTCGNASATCTVFCDFEPLHPTTQPPETTLPPVTVPDGFVLKLRRTEFTMSAKYPDPYQLFKETNGVKPSDITWSVDDPTIAAVDENGYVSPVGKGWTMVRASIAGQTASCKVIVSFDPKPAGEPKYTISNKDVTLQIGETFFLTLTDERGVKINVEWVASMDGFLTIDGSKIVGKEVTPNPITVSCVYEDVTYACVVRVKEPEKQE